MKNPIIYFLFLAFFVLNLKADDVDDIKEVFWKYVDDRLSNDEENYAIYFTPKTIEYWGEIHSLFMNADRDVLLEYPTYTIVMVLALRDKSLRDPSISGMSPSDLLNYLENENLVLFDQTGTIGIFRKYAKVSLSSIDENYTLIINGAFSAQGIKIPFERSDSGWLIDGSVIYEERAKDLEENRTRSRVLKQLAAKDLLEREFGIQVSNRLWKPAKDR